MTVISTVISPHCTVHASDSYRTKLVKGRRVLVDAKKTKIHPVKRLRGAISYWGLVELGQWNTDDWLAEMVGTLHGAGDSQTPESFAELLRDSLKREFRKMRFRKPSDAGLGLHFTAYEPVEDYVVPELFLISNWSFAEGRYSVKDPSNFGMGRETYHHIPTNRKKDGTAKQHPKPEHRQLRYRKLVKAFLDQRGILRYNNGDPLLYNRPANAIWDMYRELDSRGHALRSARVAQLRKLSRYPIEMVKYVQKHHCKKDWQLVGGKIHNLAVTPAGRYSSDSGGAKGLPR